MNDAQCLPEDFANVYEAAFARLQIRVETACMSEPPFQWPAQVAAAIRATLAFAAAHPDAAYVLTSGALAHGKGGFARYDRMLDHFAELLRPVAPSAPRARPCPRSSRRRWPAAWRR